MKKELLQCQVGAVVGPSWIPSAFSLGATTDWRSAGMVAPRYCRTTAARPPASFGKSSLLTGACSSMSFFISSGGRLDNRFDPRGETLWQILFSFTKHPLTVTLPPLATTPDDYPVHPRAPTRIAANPPRYRAEARHCVDRRLESLASFQPERNRVEDTRTVLNAIVLLWALFLSASATAQSQATELHVGVFPLAPFVMEQNGVLTGFSIDLCRFGRQASRQQLPHVQRRAFFHAHEYEVPASVGCGHDKLWCDRVGYDRALIDASSEPPPTLPRVLTDCAGCSYGSLGSRSVADSAEDPPYLP